MPQPHGLQTKRFEYKYLIHEGLVGSLRDFAAGYLEPDEHAGASGTYDVHSLYLDSPSLALCRSTIQGHKNRFKLRIRYYDHSPDSPAYCEIKRRVHDVIRKQRAAVRREAVGKLLAGRWADRRFLVRDSEPDFATLQAFCSLRDELQADGTFYVSYNRQAYVSRDNEFVRVTFDRLLGGSRYRREPTLSASPAQVPVPVRGVILELKFTDLFPNWMRHLVQAFDLERTSVAKYVTCVTRLSVLAGGSVCRPYPEHCREYLA